jgi:uncharacterized membrane protein
MLKTAKTALFTLVALLVPVLAFAQDAAPEATEVPAEDFGELVNMMISAAKGGEWSLFVAALIMVLVFLATKIKFIDNLLPAKAKPWVAAVAGVLGAVATVAMTTGDWLQAVLSGLVTGAAASGLWELIGKRILKKDAPAEEPATTEGA